MNNNLECQQCGAQCEVVTKGGVKYLECPACGWRSLFNTVTSEEDTLLYVASDLLRSAKFDEASEKYEGILARFPHSHAAHWGALLAEYNIQFVDDIIENKKVPTIHNTSIKSLLDTAHYKKAVEFAPKEMQESYQTMANKIEKIRQEWIVKASKEAPYDIFICFKDSDLANGIKRTADSVAASEIYTYLTRKGYNVFFSRESLRDKVAENYEPYIFNALNTAQIMIVYGTNAEYMQSVWMKNEWSRYIEKIRNGDKQPNSLVIAYEKMDASELPSIFKRMQCLDASQKTFYEDLITHIDKVLAICKKPIIALEKRQINVGAVGKKATSINTQKVERTSLGNIDVPQLTQDDNAKMKMAKMFCEQEMFTNAISVLNGLIEKNEFNSEALWWRILAMCNCKDGSELSSKISRLESFEDIKKVITYAGGEKQALEYLKMLAEGAKSLIDVDVNKAVRLCGIVLGFKSNLEEPLLNHLKSKSLEYLKTENAQNNSRYKFEEIKSKFNVSFMLFHLYLKYFDPKKVDEYIALHLERMNVAIKYGIFAYVSQLAADILKVDEGNVDAMWGIICGKIKFDGAKCCGGEIENFSDFELLEKMLSYCKNQQEGNKYLFCLLDLAIPPIDKTNVNKMCVIIDRLLSYLKDENAIMKYLLAVGEECLHESAFDKAERYYAIAVTKNDKDYGAFWQLLLAKNKCSDDKALLLAERNIDENPEFTSATTAALLANDDNFVKKCLSLSKEQPIRKAEYKREKKAEKEKKRNKRLYVSSYVIEIILAITMIVTLGFFGRMMYHGLPIILMSLQIAGFVAASITFFVMRKKLGIKIWGGYSVAWNKGHAVFESPLAFFKVFTHVVVFCCLICTCVMPFTTNVNTETDSKNFEFTVVEDKITITKYVGSKVNVVIPREIGGQEVTKIGDSAFSECTSLKSVVIPDRVEEIGSNAFYKCSKLASVTIGESVQTIGGRAFMECKSLTNIVLPNNVKTFGYRAFYKCINLKSVTIGKGVTSIGSDLFEYSPVKDISYSGTIAQWKNISKYSSWKDGVTVHCTDGNLME